MNKIRHTNKHTLRVIGIGSNHGADQVGWIACELLQKKIQAYPVDWKFCRTPAQLPELMQNCDAVVLVDAVLSDKPAGQVLSLKKDDLLALSLPCSSHGIGVAQALQLTEALKQLPACCEILGITVNDPQMKPETIAQAASRQLEYKVNNIINKLTQSYTTPIKAMR